MSNWKTYKLGEIADINPKVSLKQGVEYSFVEMKDLEPSFKYVSPSAIRAFKGGSKFQNRDTLFARITPCLENGKICQVKNIQDGFGFGSTEFLVFRGKENLSDTDFIYYLARTDYVRNNAVQAMTGTSGRQRVEKSAIENLEVLAPDLATQKQIATILSSLDDKIELNQQMSQTLEGIAQSIFKEWFVSFNFPGFDGELVNGLPKGWSNRKLDDIVYVKGGTTPSTAIKEYWDGEYYWSTPKDLSNLKFPVLLDTERKITMEGVKQISSGILPKGTLLLSSRAPIGYLAITQMPVSINQGYIAIQGKLVSNLFMLYWLQYNMEAVKSRANGSTFQEISKSNFRQIDIILPHENVLQQFEEIVSPLFERIVINEEANRTLRQIRDSILPQLMSGKIEIKA
jgi:type I restriction enzyme, S subunit